MAVAGAADAVGAVGPDRHRRLDDALRRSAPRRPGRSAGGATGPDGDYVPASGTVTFQPGETTATATVLVRGDEVPEPDEYVVVSFRSPTNARMGGFWGLGFAVIADDD